MANFMTQTVVAIADDSVELWDGASFSEPRHRTKATVKCFVGRPHDFQVNDLVDIVIVLRERPEPKASS